MAIEKTYFRIEKELYQLDSVKNFLAANPDLDVQGLLKISSDTVRVFHYFIDSNGEKKMTSQLINT